MIPDIWDNLRRLKRSYIVFSGIVIPWKERGLWSQFQRSQPPSRFILGVPRLKFGELLLVLLNYPHKLRSRLANRNRFPSHVCRTAAVDLYSLIYMTRGGCAYPEGPLPLGLPTRVQEGCRLRGVPTQHLLAPGEARPPAPGPQPVRR